MEYFNIGIIGTGNVALHLATALEAAGHVITHIYGRDINKAAALAERLYDAEPTNELDFSESEAGIFLIAVSDNAIEEVATGLIVPDHAVIAHTSGSKPLQVLENYHPHVGVFYPLQTFSQVNKINFEEIPLLIEYNNNTVKESLTALGLSLSKEVYYLNSEQRRVLHVGAVFACNFVNHMMTLSKRVVEAEELPFKLLHPLMKETFRKAMKLGPEAAQTGPALRGDFSVVNAHLEMLADNKELASLYREISMSIYNNR